MDAFQLYVYFVVVVIGLCMGSFLNCFAWRITHNMKVSEGHSICPECGHELGVKDLVPVFSYIFSKGKCRYCNKPIPKRYPISELVCVAGYLSIYYVYGFGPETLELWVFFSCLFLASLVDIDSFIIPNGCVITAFITRLVFLGYLYTVFPGMAKDLFKMGAVSLLGVGLFITIVTVIMDKVLHKPSMGGGDIKLLAVAAFYFGWQNTLLLIIIACVLGIIHGVWYMKHNDSNTSDVPVGAFPWGPSIAVATWFVALVGNDVLLWYISLFR